MTTNEQIQFVKELTKSITNELINDIKIGKIPPNWDGIELRQIIADKCKRTVLEGALVGSRKREYNNIVLVNNL